MSLFLLLARPSGNPVPVALRTVYERAACCRELTLEWTTARGAALLAGRGQTTMAPAVARLGTRSAIGIVRLDHRPSSYPAADGEAHVNDLAIVLNVIQREGEHAIPGLLGDFAFAVWDESAQTLLAARDAFGVKRLFYRIGPDLIALASRADLLATGEYDRHMLLALAASCAPPQDRSAYAHVRALPPGNLLTVRQQQVLTRRYWSPDQFAISAKLAADPKTAAATFRDLFAAAVQCRLTGQPDTWAQLSGGLDSSSVVCMARHLVATGRVAHGCTGTISWVYRWSRDSDERPYSDTVARHAGVLNTTLADDWFWASDPEGLPYTDHPAAEYAMYAREMRTCRLLRQAGARVLLTGYGSDHYLSGNMFFFADWMVRGHLRAACREMLRRAALGRVSFWELAYQNAVLPLLPARCQRALVPGTGLPDWVNRDTARRFGLTGTADADSYAAGRRGDKYRGLVLETMRGVAYGLDRHAIVEAVVDVRHPFLYRPLVEFGLQLPPELCVQPHARKWILRQAMRGILPETVRTRVGKGTNAGCTWQSLVHARPALERLLEDPILAQLGCIDPAKLRTAYSSACSTGADDLVGAVSSALAIELWLQARSGSRVFGESTRSTSTKRVVVSSDVLQASSAVGAPMLSHPVSTR